ncbi:VOC family protein [Pseudalkalibacillus caeni]|uniref:VOC family protein n=1 Tax=Exobacillus caeni TaxID=2574798 RepID=A0A5R9F8Y1_9BACL|nr:VOC family protein [Pseudalkalibacillus caeni]TLS36165.1 VOC family protein [Pseudalkalibacillus caeni]
MQTHTGVTFQVRVADYDQGKKWYEQLFNRRPDFIPHADFAEWEIVKGAWLQVAKGEPTKGNGPLRVGVKDIHSERERLMNVLDIEIEEVNTREDVPAAWCTFNDPDGNRVGLFQELE